MATEAGTIGLVADPRALEGLRAGAHARPQQALREVARQFESLFAQTLIRSMRAARLGEGIFDSEQSELYQDLFDQQLAAELSRGKGLGLADLLLRQLAGTPGEAGPGDVATAPPAAPATAGAGTGLGRPAGRGAVAAAAVSPPANDRAAPSAAPSAGSPPGWPPASREDFVRTLWPHAELVGRSLGVHPATIVSHAALESGWGRQTPAAGGAQPSFNLFGIKAGGGWGGAAATASTVEYEAGRPVRRQERFRAYESLAAGMGDFGRLLARSPRYAAALGTGTDVRSYAEALQRGGYATDPDYAGKLGRVAEVVQSLLRSGALKFGAGRPISSITGAM